MVLKKLERWKNWKRNSRKIHVDIFFFFLIFCYLDRVFYIFIENNFQNNARIGGYDITFFIFDMENRVSDI